MFGLLEPGGRCGPRAPMGGRTCKSLSPAEAKIAEKGLVLRAEGFVSPDSKPLRWRPHFPSHVVKAVGLKLVISFGRRPAPPHTHVSPTDALPTVPVFFISPDNLELHEAVHDDPGGQRRQQQVQTTLRFQQVSHRLSCS